MAKEIVVKVSGAYRTVKEVWIKVGGEYHRVWGVYEKLNGVYRTSMDYMPGKPGSFRVKQSGSPAKDDQDYTSVTFTWSAPTSGESVEAYEILRRPEGAAQSVTPTVVKRLTAADGTFFSTRTWKVTGLAANTTYVFSVRAVNTTPGVDVVGDESNPLKIYTGVSEKRESGSSRHQYQADKDKPLEWRDWYEFQPTKADTFCKERLWSTPGAQGRPAQGTYDDTRKDSRNQYGCIDYTGIYNSLVSRHGKVMNYDTGKEVAIADYVRVTKATIQTIGRPKGTGGVNQPTLSLHNGNFMIGANVVPTVETAAAGSFTVSGPKLGEKTGPISNAELKSWADEWARPPASRHRTGIVVYRGDGEHECVLAGVNESGTTFDNSWDLQLEYDWDFKVRSAKAYSNAAYTWPT